MSGLNHHILVVAGETSGDKHGADLVRALHDLDASLTFSGLGGPKMKAEGVQLTQDFTELAVMGFTEILKNYFKFKKAFNAILQEAESTKAKAIILIDYPGFNLRLAKALKAKGLKVIYYISPKVWAWKESRVKQIKAYVDQLLVILPFEKEFYRKHNVNAIYVGNPLLEQVRVTEERPVFLTKHRCDLNKRTIILMPGSRKNEILRLLGIMVEASQQLAQKYPDLQFILLRAPNVDPGLLEAAIGRPLPDNIVVIDHDHYNAIHAADFCLVASGTATLEVGILGKPMVVVYRGSLITEFLSKLIIKIPYVSLVNIIAGKKIVPEFLRASANPTNVFTYVDRVLNNPKEVQHIQKGLQGVKDKLGQGQASSKAAKHIKQYLKSLND